MRKAAPFDVQALRGQPHRRGENRWIGKKIDIFLMLIRHLNIVHRVINNHARRAEPLMQQKIKILNFAIFGNQKQLIRALHIIGLDQKRNGLLHLLADPNGDLLPEIALDLINALKLHQQGFVKIRDIDFVHIQTTAIMHHNLIIARA